MLYHLYVYLVIVSLLSITLCTLGAQKTAMLSYTAVIK